MRLTAFGEGDSRETGIAYRVLSETEAADTMTARLTCRGVTAPVGAADAPVTRRELAAMLLPLADRTLAPAALADTDDPACRLIAANGFLKADKDGRFHPNDPVPRQQLATVAMQACGVNYRNASSTMPVCRDVAEVQTNYGTNVARALYFGFMELEDGAFCPKRETTLAEACAMLERVADFAGL